MRYLVILECALSGDFAEVFRSTRRPNQDSIVLNVHEQYDAQAHKVFDIIEEDETRNYLIECEEGVHIYTARVYDCGSIKTF